MSQIADNTTGDHVTSRDAGALNRRILGVMIVAVAGTALITATFVTWRVTTGLLLGGGLSVLNFTWMHTSVAAIFQMNAESSEVRTRGFRYLLRYLVIGLSVFAAYQLNLVSLAATIAGLCAFVPALMFEAIREFCFVIIHREESH